MFDKLKALKSSLHLRHSKHSSKDMKGGMAMSNKEGMMDDMSMSTAPKSDGMMASDMSPSDMSSKDMSMDTPSKGDMAMNKNDKDGMMMEGEGSMSKDKDGMEGAMSNGTMKDEMSKDMGMNGDMKMEKDDMKMDKNMKDMTSDMSNGMMKKSEPQIAIFGAGCFWGTENMFLKHYPPKENKGVISTSVGFIDGVKDVTDPSGKTTKGGGSAEACRVVFDPSVVSYAELVEFFYRFHDPTMLNYQGNDKGKEYRSAIFTFSDEQVQIARRVTAEVRAKHFDPKGQKLVTRIETAGSWQESPAAHQQYLARNPNGYHCYTHKLHW